MAASKSVSSQSAHLPFHRAIRFERLGTAHDPQAPDANFGVALDPASENARVYRNPPLARDFANSVIKRPTRLGLCQGRNNTPSRQLGNGEPLSAIDGMRRREKRREFLALRVEFFSYGDAV